MAKRYKDRSELLLGMEVMDTLDYTMPVRKLLYDAEEYHRQMGMVIRCNKDAAKEITQQESIADGEHPKGKYWRNSGEFLYGLHKEDKIPPLITVALYCGNEKYDGCNDLKDMLKLEPIETECREWIVGYPLHVIALQDLNEEYFQTGLRELIGNKQLIECKQEEGGLDMCKAFDDVRLEGKIEGRIEGKLEGIQEGIYNSIQNLMKNLQMTSEQAMEALGIPQGEREMYLKRI